MSRRGSKVRASTQSFALRLDDGEEVRGVLTTGDIATAAGKAADIVAPGVVSPAAVGEAAAAGAGAAVNAAATAADRVAGLAKTATTLPRRALEAVRLQGAPLACVRHSVGV